MRITDALADLDDAETECLAAGLTGEQVEAVKRLARATVAFDAARD